MQWHGRNITVLTFRVQHLKTTGRQDWKKHTKMYKNVMLPYQHTQKVSHKNNK